MKQQLAPCCPRTKPTTSQYLSPLFWLKFIAICLSLRPQVSTVLYYHWGLNLVTLVTLTGSKQGLSSAFKEGCLGLTWCVECFLETIGGLHYLTALGKLWNSNAPRFCGCGTLNNLNHILNCKNGGYSNWRHDNVMYVKPTLRGQSLLQL